MPAASVAALRDGSSVDLEDLGGDGLGRIEREVAAAASLVFGPDRLMVLAGEDDAITINDGFGSQSQNAENRRAQNGAKTLLVSDFTGTETHDSKQGATVTVRY